MTLPLTVFNFDKLSFAQTASRFTTVFWMIDIFFNFFVGFYLKDGRVEMRMRKIALQYLRTWFVFDMVVVSADIILEIMDRMGNSATDLVRVGKGARMVRVTRAFRLIRLVRLLKLMYVIEALFDFVLSGPLFSLFNITKIIIGLAIIVHFMGLRVVCSRLGIAGQRRTILVDITGRRAREPGVLVLEQLPLVDRTVHAGTQQLPPAELDRADVRSPHTLRRFGPLLLHARQHHGAVESKQEGSLLAPAPGRQSSEIPRREQGVPPAQQPDHVLFARQPRKDREDPGVRGRVVEALADVVAARDALRGLWASLHQPGFRVAAGCPSAGRNRHLFDGGVRGSAQEGCGAFQFSHARPRCALCGERVAGLLPGPCLSLRLLGGRALGACLERSMLG
mmetsp:Transcript_84502/g.272383  ORF Transcript_84502/g.272383 Transcript_84502/m.272383 type:complete len:394 (-) Transcript_84502:599-1780(-)